MFVVACDKGSPPKPTPAPAPPPAQPVVVIDAAVEPVPNECEKASAKVQAAYDAYQKAMADQQLELIKANWLPVPFQHWHGGRPPPADFETKQEPARRAFAHKKMGDHVQWRDPAGHVYAGVYIDSNQEWTLAKRGTKVFLVKPRSVSAIPCVDPKAMRMDCFSGEHDPALLALPPGTTFGGTMTIDVELFRVEVSGGRRAPCPA